MAGIRCADPRDAERTAHRTLAAGELMTQPEVIVRVMMPLSTSAFSSYRRA
jgi:hypothetical protein